MESAGRRVRPGVGVLIDRLIYGAASIGGVVPFETLASLALPICEVEYGGEAHYLIRVEGDAHITACGGELPKRPPPTSEPLCPQCSRVIKEWGYDDSISRRR